MKFQLALDLSERPSRHQVTHLALFWVHLAQVDLLALRLGPLTAGIHGPERLDELVEGVAGRLLPGV